MLRATGSLNRQIGGGTPPIWKKEVKYAPLSVLAGGMSVKKYGFSQIHIFSPYGLRLK